jgi:uncharacterized repeat protein (TIGR01451 family)
MKKSMKMLATSGVTSVALAGLAVSPVFAWHPQGKITKTVQDVTTHSAVSSAQDGDHAITAASGDTLMYTVVVSNVGAPAANGDDDMAFTVMTDNLPSGVELVGNPSQRTITENIGTIKPGQSVTKQYAVKVTDQNDGDVLTNQACFQGNSIVKDNPQSSCSKVVVKVHVPPKPTPTPTPQPTKPTPKPTPQPTMLPNTGAGDFIVPAIVVTVLGYAGYLLRLKRHRP